MVQREVIRRLSNVVGSANVLVDADQRAGFERDWTGRFTGECVAVVRPATTAEVAAVVRACVEAGVPICIQGGNTGLVAGAVPSPGSIVLSTTRLSAVGPIDSLSGQVTVGAGVTLSQLQTHARPTGRYLPVDLGARDSCTIGGMMATNAGGTAVLRHGMMRAHVCGVEAVRADGTVISSLRGLDKDNTGFDLAGLLCGSEGVLAIITAVRVRLQPLPSHTVTAVLGVSSAADAVELVASVRQSLPSLVAAEMMQRPTISLLESMTGRTCPIDASVVVLLEAESHDRDDLAADRLAQSLAAAINATSVGVTGQPAVAMDDSARASLWSWRDRLTEAINHTAVPVKLDVSVPLGRCAEFVERLHAIALSASIDANAVALHVFGHLGDGNLHVNIVGLLSRTPTDDEQLAAHDAEESVLSLVAELGGSISAEHGIGTAKRWALPLTRTPEELAAFAALKQAFDPLLLLNPTVLLPQRDASDRSSTPVEAS